MWVWFVGVAMGVAYVLEASLKKLAPMLYVCPLPISNLIHDPSLTTTICTMSSHICIVNCLGKISPL